MALQSWGQNLVSLPYENFQRKEDDNMEELAIQNRIRMLSARTDRANSRIINKLKRRLYRLQAAGDKA